MKLAVLMDPLHKLKPYKDSTIAMLKGAQALGWSCVYFTLADLYCKGGVPMDKCLPLKWEMKPVRIGRKALLWVNAL
ncbi:glutathione synthetase [Legionella feeleii]|uniref:Glutathione synthetase n=1 Tax=Legionella feeleii TaxID=453 RepID=A0A2X1QUJ2_9GAMM|nr:glutathione synthetase [Legionella feeleii]